MICHGESTGSNRTPLPKRLAMTSSPVKRSCFGSLTAWLRPEGVTLPGSYLTTTGLALPVLHPDHLVLLRVSAVN